MGRQRSRSSAPQDKLCLRCGRVIQWRRKWAKDWEHVRYCSKACRSAGLTQQDHDIQRVMLEALRADGRLEVGAFAQAQGWDASQREAVRMAARRIVMEHPASLWQQGRRVDASTARGDFELRWT